LVCAMLLGSQAPAASAVALDKAWDKNSRRSDVFNMDMCS
jgi:hypothetical protein